MCVLNVESSVFYRVQTVARYWAFILPSDRSGSWNQPAPGGAVQNGCPDVIEKWKMAEVGRRKAKLMLK